MGERGPRNKTKLFVSSTEAPFKNIDVPAFCYKTRSGDLVLPDPFG